MPFVAETAEMVLTDRPDRLILVVPGVPATRCRQMALDALQEARRLAPKLTGESAKRMSATWGSGFFGVRWADPQIWFQEAGVRAFTMKNLAGKTIPMWVDDPTGQERQKNPKAETRRTASGKMQVLIFRRAVRPGAPGRINKREAGKPYTTKGRQGGRIAKGNAGVKWRFPGLEPRFFINTALSNAARRGSIIPVRVYVADESWTSRVSLAATPGRQIGA